MPVVFCLPIDVVVGAPYEDNGSGAVYIYHGTVSGVHRGYSQRISLVDTHRQLTTVGYSLAGEIDLDGNGYPGRLAIYRLVTQPPSEYRS